MTWGGINPYRRRDVALAAALTAALLAAGCSSCSGGGAANDGGTDSDSEIVFGETTPCANAAQPGEVCVPGGNYLMGCVPGDTECEDNEKPLVMVTLSPFFVDRNEATIKEVIEWMNEVKDEPGFVTDPYFAWTDGTKLYRIWGTSWHIGVNSEGSVPIVLRDSDGNYYFNPDADTECPLQGGAEAAAGGFSWLGAKMFCEHKGMQLPTEAQWEAAARGQTTNIWPCGSDLAECWYGIYACCTSSATCGDYYADTWCHCCAPFSADHADVCLSPFGIIGMYGNAAEWTADYISVDHSACADGCVDPQFSEEPYSGAVHVLKGGDMYAPSQSWLRISKRTALNGDDGSSDTGVRCVRPDEPFVMPDAGNDGGK